jgi:hypothetical protein
VVSARRPGAAGRRRERALSDDVPVKVVGFGPFPLPGEKRRRRKAHDEARRLLALADEARLRDKEER